MSDHLDQLKKKRLKIEELLAFGFILENERYYYSELLVDEQFLLEVWLSPEGQISTEMIDQSTQESYVLHLVPTATGSFIGQVRQEYQAILQKIEEVCFESEVFNSEQSLQVMQFIKDNYQDQLEFLWARSPKNGIARRQDNKKWYLAVLSLHKEKLGLKEEGTIEVIDLRGTPEEIDSLVDHVRYFPGYHMNKKYWYTICLDGSVPIKELEERIIRSYHLADK